MSTALITILSVYGGAALVALAVALISKSYFNSQSKSKIKSYQHEISRCHSRILKLEQQNELLERKLTRLESTQNRTVYSYAS